MELTPVAQASQRNTTKRRPSGQPRPISIQDDGAENADITGELPAPSTAVEVLQRWNSPKSNRWRLAATCWSFAILGANDAAYGVSGPIIGKQRIPYSPLLGFDPICMGPLTSLPVFEIIRTDGYLLVGKILQA